jgi:hypothetical protein
MQDEARTMKWRDWLGNWRLTSLKINIHFLEAEWAPKEADKDAAWELYIELLTRITTQPLPREHGIEATALASVFALFELTRETIKRHGRQCLEFTKIAIVVLNQVVRPFTAKWHRLSQQGAFEDTARCAEFRTELEDQQAKLREYTRMLADLAGVEDLTSLEATEAVPTKGGKKR